MSRSDIIAAMRGGGANAAGAILWAKVSPIVEHAVVAIVLIGAFCVVGILLRALEKIFPAFMKMLEFLEQVDLWLVAAVFCLFAVHTLAIVALRIRASLLDEVLLEHVRRREPPRKA